MLDVVLNAWSRKALLQRQYSSKDLKKRGLPKHLGKEYFKQRD